MREKSYIYTFILKYKKFKYIRRKSLRKIGYKICYIHILQKNIGTNIFLFIIHFWSV